jgi:flavin reductase (DIM6/NTAB) family NADH-FMN oxidoreductase RutF
MVDSLAFRDALGHFATGVAVITALDSNRRPVGVTVSSFASLSLEPPLILFCLGLNTASLDAYASHGVVAINVLAEGQHDVAEAFAVRNGDKFATVGHRTADNGCALLDGCLVGLECDVTSTSVGGDHLIIVGRVMRIHRGDGDAPLLRYLGRYARIGPPLDS